MNRNRPLSWWWLSYADGDEFNGACIVEAKSFLHAVSEAGRLRCRPENGGQVAGGEITHAIHAIEARDRMRLLDVADARRVSVILDRIGPPKPLSPMEQIDAFADDYADDTDGSEKDGGDRG